MDEVGAESLPVDPNILENLFEGAYVITTDKKILYWNKAAERISGYSSEETVGLSCADNLLMHVDSQGKDICTSDCPADTVFETGNPSMTRVFMQHKNGHRVPVAIRTLPLFEGEEITGAIELFREDLALHALRERLRELQEVALLDTLTGIGNRKYAADILKQRSAEMERYGRPFGIVYLDIDSFMKVNETYGHEVGDSVLRMVARSLLGTVRPFDSVTRWGGEEFLAILQNVEERQLEIIAERMRRIIELSSVDASGERIQVTVSAGATLARTGEEVDDLVERADALLFEAKKQGKNRIEIQ